MADERSEQDVVVEVVSEYTLSLLPEDHDDFELFAVRVCRRAPGRWAVVRGPWCLNRSGYWHSEPTPSSRTDEWLNDHRFCESEALSVARVVLADVVINGKRPADLLGGGVSGGEAPR